MFAVVRWNGLRYADVHITAVQKPVDYRVKFKVLTAVTMKCSAFFIDYV
jgi:hypothetical protein